MNDKTVNKVFRLPDINKEFEVGIEVEMEGRRLPEGAGPYWNVHRDGSLGPDGKEYVTDGPIHRENVKRAILDLWDAFEDIDLRPSRRCGVHVHLNFLHSTMDQVLNFVTLFLIFETPLVRWCSPDREGNLFCLRSSDAEGGLQNLLRSSESGRWGDINNDRYRYSALNLISLAKFGSIESRTLPTEKEYTRILTWIDVLLEMKDRAHEFHNCQEIVENMSARGAKEFLQHVFPRNWALFDCRELEDMVREGVWTAQDLAYSKMAQRFEEMMPRPVAKNVVLNARVIGNIPVVWEPAPMPDDEPEAQGFAAIVAKDQINRLWRNLMGARNQ